MLLALLLPLLLPRPLLAATSDELRRQVEMLGEAGGLAASHPVANSAALVQLYGANQYRPLWFEDGPLAAQRAALLAEIEASAGHGFTPRRYHYDALTAATQPVAELDLLYTDALLSQARHRYGGVISTLDEDWFFERQQLDAAAFARDLLAESGDVGQTLQALWPQHAQYQALLAKRAALASQPDVFTQPVPPGPLLRPGHSGERVRQLQLRLYGPGAYSGYYDAELLEAVKEFQRDAGLEPDGLVGLWKQRLRWARGNVQITRVFKTLWFRKQRHAGLGSWSMALIWFSIFLMPIFQVTASVSLLGLWLAGSAWTWTLFRTLWIIAGITYVIVTVQAVVIDFESARGSWREGILFPGLLSLTLIIHALMPGLIPPLTRLLQEPAPSPIVGLIYAWLALGMVVAWSAKWVEDKRGGRWLAPLLLTLAGYGSFLCAVTFASYVKEIQGTAMVWDKTVKTGKVS